MKKLLLVLTLLLTCYPQLSAEDNQPLVDEIEKTVVAICIGAPNIKNINGTGFIISPDGIIATADHVISDNKGVTHERLFALRPTYPKYEKFKLTVLKRFRYGLKGRDIALLKISTESQITKLPYIPFAKTYSIGDPVIIVGFPLVFDRVYIWPLARKGVVASTRYNYQKSKIIILDMGSVAGFSGSPVISLKDFGIIGIMRGKSSKQKNVDFSVATRFSEEDIQ